VCPKNWKSWHSLLKGGIQPLPMLLLPGRVQRKVEVNGYFRGKKTCFITSQTYEPSSSVAKHCFVVFVAERQPVPALWRANPYNGQKGSAVYQAWQVIRMVACQPHFLKWEKNFSPWPHVSNAFIVELLLRNWMCLWIAQ